MAGTLRHAALYLLRHGWVQDDFFARRPDPDNPFPAADVIGAVVMAVTGRRMLPCEIRDTVGPHADREFSSAIDYLRRWLGLPADTADIFGGLYEWNDEPWQDQGHVIDGLMAAAADRDGVVYLPGDYLVAGILTGTDIGAGAR